jgi:hypothetical protein
VRKVCEDVHKHAHAAVEAGRAEDDGHAEVAEDVCGGAGGEDIY